MPKAHRQGDQRACGSTTIVTGQSTVFVKGKLWAVEGDMNTDGGGQLVSTTSGGIMINGKRAIVVGDSALPDALCPIPGGAHCNPVPVTGAEITYGYGY